MTDVFLFPGRSIPKDITLRVPVALLGLAVLIAGPTYVQPVVQYQCSGTPQPLKFAAAVRPINNYDWPVPKAAQPSIELRTFLRPLNLSLLAPLPLGVAAEITGPTYVLRLPQDHIAGTPTVLKRVESPFFQVDLPVPRGAVRNPQDWVLSGLSLTVRPCSQLDWPNPLPQPKRNEQLSWIVGFSLTNTPVSNPFIQTDWPVPQPPLRRNEQLGQVIGATITTPFNVIQAQTNWPNPRGFAPLSLSFSDSFKLPLQTIEPANQYDWPNPRGYQRSVDLLTWLQTGYAEEAGEPFSQTDWPVTRAILRLTSLSWTDSFKLPLQTIEPSNQYDWPVPRGPQPLNLGSTDSFKLSLQAVVQPNQYDWPVPKGPQCPVSHWSQSGFNVLQIIPPTAFSLADWPNPRGAQQPALTWTDSFKLSLQSIVPPNQYNWPVPRGYVRNEFGYTQQTQLLSTAVQTPLFNEDQPNPRGPIRNEFGWTDSFKLSLIGADKLPVRQPDQPNPRGPQRSIDLLTWAQTVYLEEVSKPFRQLDWPNPRAAQLPQQWNFSFRLPLTITIGFNQYDWPNPRLRDPFVIGTPEAVIGISPLATPVGIQRDWPNPLGPRPIVQDYRFRNLLTLTSTTPWQPVSELKIFKRSLSVPTTGPNLVLPVFTPALLKPAPNRDWPNPRLRDPFVIGTPEAVIGIVPLPTPVGIQRNWPNPRGPNPLVQDFSLRNLLTLTSTTPWQPVSELKIFKRYLSVSTTGPNLVLPHIFPIPIEPPPVVFTTPKTHRGSTRSGVGVTTVRSGSSQVQSASGKSRDGVRSGTAKPSIVSGSNKSDAQDP
jgi:hypothetical protein